MIGVIWNCQGLGKPGKFEFLRELITRHKADFIGLQETKRKEFDQRWFEAINPQKKFEPPFGPQHCVVPLLQHDKTFCSSSL